MTHERFTSKEDSAVSTVDVPGPALKADSAVLATWKSMGSEQSSWNLAPEKLGFPAASNLLDFASTNTASDSGHIGDYKLDPGRHTIINLPDGTVIIHNPEKRTLSIGKPPQS